MPGHTDYPDDLHDGLEAALATAAKGLARATDLATREVAGTAKTYRESKHVIHVLRGLPASGKTTVAFSMVRHEKVKRVSKDDLRAMLHGGEYTPETEMFVLKVRDAIVETAICSGFDVVVDDTNLNPAHVEALTQLAHVVGAMVDIIDLDTPLEKCIQRDALRDKPVGEAVIRGMHDQYLSTERVGDG